MEQNYHEIFEHIQILILDIKVQRQNHQVLVEYIRQKSLHASFLTWKKRLSFQKTANMHRHDKILKRNFMEWKIIAAKQHAMKVQRQKLEQNCHFHMVSWFERQYRCRRETIIVAHLARATCCFVVIGKTLYICLQATLI